MSAPFVLRALTAADSLAHGSQSLAGTNSARAACLLARQALEAVVNDLLAGREMACPDGSMRSRLIALSQAYADEPDVAYRASTAWWRLSTACHHHAYDLDPTPAEAASVVTPLAGQSAACPNRQDEGLAMGNLLQVRCRQCGTEGDEVEGTVMSGYLPRCVQCGKSRLVAIWDLYASDPPGFDPSGPDASELREARIGDLAGRCRCGGHFTLTAPIRCSRCRSADVEIASLGSAD